MQIEVASTHMEHVSNLFKLKLKLYPYLQPFRDIYLHFIVIIFIKSAETWLGLSFCNYLHPHLDFSVQCSNFFGIWTLSSRLESYRSFDHHFGVLLSTDLTIRPLQEILLIMKLSIFSSIHHYLCT